MQKQSDSLITPPKREGGDSSYIPKSPELDKSSAEYKALGDKFDKQFGEKADLKFLEEVSKRLDNKFKVLSDFTKEAETTGCDMLLFKNVISPFSLTPNRSYNVTWPISRMKSAKLGMPSKSS